MAAWPRSKPVVPCCCRASGALLVLVVALVLLAPLTAAFVPVPRPAAAAGVVGYRLSRSSTTTMASSSGNWFGGGKPDPQALVRQGMDEFRQGKIQESIDLFDQALALDSRLEPYLWQRGLSLYYAERFAEGAVQFRKDVAVNPADTEESVWAFLCEAQMPEIGFDKARKDMLVVGRDPRPYMRVAYDLFRGAASEEDLAHEATPSTPAEFYALLYLSLYAEARKETDKAQAYMTAACNTMYAKLGRDYMTSLAKVHLKLRGWA